MLTEGSDYLYFPSAYHSSGAPFGAGHGDVAVVATRRYLFLIPEHVGSLGPGWIRARVVWLETHAAALDLDGPIGNPQVNQRVIEHVLADPRLDVTGLEHALRDLVGRGEYVISLERLSKLSMGSRFFHQIRFRPRGREDSQVLALRDRANHDRFKTFYAPRAD